MIRITTASRLHFGLFTLPSEGAPPHWPNALGQEVLPARRFGGVGLMVRDPGLRLRVEAAAEWSAEGPLAERALGFARQFAHTLEVPGRPQRLTVEACPPEHVGLGTGTQLGLAVARALAAAYGLGGVDATELARRVGRGKRSAVGIHGFEWGGFLVEAGKRASEPVAPLAARADFPAAWRVVLVLPPWGQGLHGTAEGRALASLNGHGWSLAKTDALCRLVLLGMLPALAERDTRAFGEALHDFNRRVGEAFRPVQGGAYTHPRTVEVVEFVRGRGVPGVGQTSWGPGVFAVVGDEGQADDLAHAVRQQFGLDAGQIVVTPAANRGATVG